MKVNIVYLVQQMPCFIKELLSVNRTQSGFVREVSFKSLPAVKVIELFVYDSGTFAIFVSFWKDGNKVERTREGLTFI